MKKIILLIFALVAAGNLVSQISDTINWQVYTKPVLMPLLILYVIVSSGEKKALHHYLLAALFFSWLGDVSLMFQGKEIYFMLGLGSFLVAHILYIFAYRNAKWAEEVNGLLSTQRMRYIFILVLAGCGLLYVLLPKLGSLTIPVIVYAGVLVVMAVVALNRYGFTSLKSFGLIFSGAILFMMSDSILAVNKFLESFAMAGFWIMLTYISAQFLIVKGLLEHEKSL